MIKLLKYGGIVILLAGIGLLIAAFMADTWDISISEDTAQQAVEAKMPFQVEKSGVTINITEANVDFLASDQAHITFKGKAERKTLSADFEGDATSSIRYSDGEFFLTNFNVGDIRIKPNEVVNEKVEKAKSIASGLLNRLKEEVPEVGEIDFEKMQADATASFKDKAVEVVSGKLETIPVYKMDKSDMKMRLAAASLQEITFADDYVTVTMDPGVIAWKILSGILIAVAALFIAIGLVRSGGGVGLLAALAVFSIGS